MKGEKNIMDHRVIRYCQKKFFPVTNSYEPKCSPTVTKRGNGFLCYNDIQYGKEFPNSFLDIYVHEDKKKRNTPTLILVHGGGFTWGNKEDGDPNAGAGDKDWFMEKFMEAGLQVVALDYAYAPDYAYPTPIIQMGQAINHLQKIADDYGLDMTRVVFCGGSAGGHLIGQFVNIQTNPDYAKKMGITAVMRPANIKAMLFNSALLDNERFAGTDNFVFNYLFRKCGNAYFHCKRLEGHPKVIESNVIENVGENFPPSFISDGNTATFYDQARDFAEKLSGLHIRHELNIYPKSEKKLLHGFESTKDKYGLDNMKKMLQFLQTVEVLNENKK